jgi:ribosomal-protein-serine acetyltransferase
LHPRIGPGGIEIGYWIHVAHANRGFATEAAGALTEWSLGLVSIDRVEIHHDVANVASQRVPEKLGFELIGTRTRPPEASGETGELRIWRRRSSTRA